MIEINVKAKGSDPWDTPALTWGQLEVKLKEGCHCAYFIFEQESGLWKLYDNLNPRNVYEPETLHKYLSSPNKWQIRAHSTDKIALVQAVTFPHDTWMDGNKRIYVQHITAPNIQELKAKVEHAKGHRPNLKLLTPHATWYPIKNPEGAPVVYS